MRPTRVLVAGSAFALVAGLAGCADEQPTHDGARAHPSTSHGPGQGSGMAGMPEVSAPPEDADWNAADATYLMMMIAHHSQAIDLTELAATRATDPRVRRLADGIDAGQGREVIVMATWLVDRGVSEPTVADVEHMTATGMPGMLSVEQVDDLAQTSGTAFDRRFLEDMVQHHQGAVAMAEQLIGTGEDVRVDEMATEVIAGQSAEISRMRELLAVLP